MVALPLLALVAAGCVAEDGTATVPNVDIGPDATDDPSGAATGVQLLVLLTVLSLAPALLVMVTSFTRIIIISELKTAFRMGFIIFVPFLIIDIVVSSALLSMGMMMLPPVVGSLPFKILLFVLVDGWSLIIGSLVTSFVV